MQELISSFLKHFSGVAAYLEATRVAARRDGSVSTLAGRRRAIKGLGATDKRCVGWLGRQWLQAVHFTLKQGG